MGGGQNGEESVLVCREEVLRKLKSRCIEGGGSDSARDLRSAFCKSAEISAPDEVETSKKIRKKRANRS